MPKYDHNEVAGDTQHKMMMESRGEERMGLAGGLFGFILSALILGLWKLIALCVRRPQVGVSLLVAAGAMALLWVVLLR